MLFPGSWPRFSKNVRKRVLRGDLEGAFRLARKYTESNPNDVRGWNTFGDMATRSKDWEVAATAFQQASRLAPEDPWFRYMTATKMVRGGHLKEARSILDAMLDEDSGAPGSSALAQVGLCEVATQERRHDEAVAHPKLAENLISADRGDWLEELAVLVLPLAGEFDRGRRLLQQAIDVGADAFAHILMSTVLSDEDPVAAQQQLTLAREKWFGSPEQFRATVADVKRTTQRVKRSRTPEA